MQGGGGKRGYDAEERRRGRKKNTGKKFYSKLTTLRLTVSGSNPKKNVSGSDLNEKHLTCKNYNKISKADS